MLLCVRSRLTGGVGGTAQKELHHWYLRCKEGSSNKFYYVRVDGCIVHIHFGRINTVGQKQQKPYASEEQAIVGTSHMM